jgi:nucleotide-binding universal stress UspA family protein
VDLSEHSRHALDEAVALGRHYGALVTVLYVIPPIVAAVPTLDSPAYPAYVYTPEELEAIELEVRRFVEGERGEQPIEISVTQGYVVAEIVATAAALRADLIVLGTHGRAGFQRLFLGSATERVLARATCPVMVVPPRSSAAVPFGRSMFARVLCAIDFTPSSLKALEFATALAQEAEATLTLVTVVETAGISEAALANGLVPPDSNGLLLSASRARLHALAPAGDAPRAGVSEVVLTGKPYPAILQLARDEHSDLIVVGAHGGLASILGLGSTANHIMRESICPVVSVRA